MQLALRLFHGLWTAANHSRAQFLLASPHSLLCRDLLLLLCLCAQGTAWAEMYRKDLAFTAWFDESVAASPAAGPKAATA